MTKSSFCVPEQGFQVLAPIHIYSLIFHNMGAISNLLLLDIKHSRVNSTEVVEKFKVEVDKISDIKKCAALRSMSEVYAYAEISRLSTDASFLPPSRESPHGPHHPITSCTRTPPPLYYRCHFTTQRAYHRVRRRKYETPSSVGIANRW